VAVRNGFAAWQGRVAEGETVAFVGVSGLCAEREEVGARMSAYQNGHRVPCPAD
jgi:hypothetical protein